MKLLKWLDTSFEEILLLIMLILITGAMTLQIVMRYVFLSPLAWAEEFCRYCYIVSVFLSLAFTLKKGNMLRVNVVVDLFPTLLRNILGLFADILLLGGFVLFFQESITRTLFVRTTGQLSPAMQIPIWMMYCVMILGFGLAIIRSVSRMCAICASRRSPPRKPPFWKRPRKPPLSSLKRITTRRA